MARNGRRVGLIVGWVLLGLSAAFWLLLLVGVAVEPSDAAVALVGAVFMSAIPIVAGVFLVRRGRTGQKFDDSSVPGFDGESAATSLTEPLVDTEAHLAQDLSEDHGTRSRLDRFGPAVGFVVLGVAIVLAFGAFFVFVPFGGDDFGDLEDEGLHLFAEGQWSEAAAVYTTLIDSYPVDDHEALALTLYRRSLVYFEQGRLEDALADESAAISHNPSDVNLLATLHLNRSREYSYLGMVDESVADATAAIELDPGDTKTLARAYVNRGQGLASLDRGEEAVADFTSAIEVSPIRADRDSVLVYRAEELARLERFEAAIGDATAAIDALSAEGSEARDGVRATTSELLGRAYLVRGNGQLFLSLQTDSLVDVAKQVETDLSHAIDSLPEDEPGWLARARYSRGVFYYFMLDDDAARRDLESVQDLVPPSHDLHQGSIELLAEIIT